MAYIQSGKKDKPTCLKCNHCIKIKEVMFCCNLFGETWYRYTEICESFKPVKFVTLMKRKANIEINS